jgi:cyclin-dependent kinase 3/cyclin-dependent kinase 12/13
MSKLIENYLLLESIGKGKYGQVYRAEHQKNKRIYAVKVIPKSSFLLNPKLEQLAINEINILSSLKHQNIVGFV